jgi:hypothetical protein
MVMREDVNDLGRKVPTEANAFAHQTVVNSKLLSLQLQGFSPGDGAGRDLRPFGRQSEEE